MTYKEVYKHLRCGNQVYLKGTNRINKLFVVERIMPVRKEDSTYSFEIVVKDDTGMYYDVTHKDILRILK